MILCIDFYYDGIKGSQDKNSILDDSYFLLHSYFIYLLTNSYFKANFTQYHCLQLYQISININRSQKMISTFALRTLIITHILLELFANIQNITDLKKHQKKNKAQKKFVLLLFSYLLKFSPFIYSVYLALEILLISLNSINIVLMIFDYAQMPSRYYQSITFNQFWLTVALTGTTDLKAVPYNLSVLPQGSDAFSRFKFHAAVPFKSSLNEVSLVTLNFALEHGYAASSLNKVISPTPPIKHLSLNQQCPLALPASLMEIALVGNAVLVFAYAPALLQSLQHLSSEADLPQLPFRHHFQNSSCRESPLLNRRLVFMLYLSCRRTVVLAAQSLLQLIFLELQLHHQLLQRAYSIQQRRNCIGHRVCLTTTIKQRGRSCICCFQLLQSILQSTDDER